MELGEVLMPRESRVVGTEADLLVERTEEGDGFDDGGRSARGMGQQIL